jgi:hypothetical protein
MLDDKLLSSPNISSFLKSKPMRWAGNVPRMGGEEKHYRQIHCENAGVDRRMILKWIVNKKYGTV